MGASFEASEAGTLPVTVHGSAALRPLNFASPVASAQVKTAVLLAGLRASGGVRVIEPARSRDHTERLLPAFGVAVKVDPETGAVSLCGPVVPQAASVAVPADPSSAAFIVVASLLVPGSRVSLTGVSLNETRTGFVRVLQRMGASVGVTNADSREYEPAGDDGSRVLCGDARNYRGVPRSTLTRRRGADTGAGSVCCRRDHQVRGRLGVAGQGE